MLWSAAEISELTRELSARFDTRVLHVAADVTDPAQIRAMCAEVEAKLGPVDILVNNAGIQHVSPLVAFDEAQWDRILAINLSSAFHTTKACLPGMTSRGYGRVINIASAHGKVASKGMREKLPRLLAREWHAKFGHAQI